jgi:hypothetical protein
MTTLKAATAAQTLYVTDLNCQPKNNVPNAPDHSQRVHLQMIDGRLMQFVFKYGEPLGMPFEHAMKFLRHSDGFLVQERLDDGHLRTYEPPPPDLDPHNPQGNRITLGDSQVIAELDELTHEALKVRAAMEAGGEKTKAFSKERLIAFLVQRRKEKALENLSPEDEGGPNSDFANVPPIDESDGANPFNT